MVVRHVSGDRIVAMIEIVSPGNKASRHGFRAFVDKACELLEARIHLLILDPFPPGPRDENGVHAAIWEEVQDEPFELPADKRLTLVAYECGLTTRAYIEPVAVGDVTPRHAPVPGAGRVCMGSPGGDVPDCIPGLARARWRNVLEPPPPSIPGQAESAEATS